MSTFLHKLAEGLRAREKFLEDHSEHPVFDTEEGGKFKAEYEDLMAELKKFSGKVEKLAGEGKDYDEHFEREIEDEHKHLSVKIDAWAESLKK
ncbi:hypothetical protein [Emcibacter nanhaiensis]|uniref:Uncharacterized protein n=1 Tax=Emcibacter nanhaiensis TaxID=1505037 RepID=A0A501PII8_9PROT|nr:hypothetical protein [Emcibacter nanhaiensis]TPD59832.1 hypothetical protein FIV46_10110 [Emcibacter nanhaiensis]